MNTLLANGEVPGLFEGEENATLMNQCKEGSHRDGLVLDTPEELYRWFTGQVMKNLHVVFTMNPSTQGQFLCAAECFWNIDRVLSLFIYFDIIIYCPV